MSDSFKDIIFNKITDEILNVVVGLSKDELNTLINQNRLQKILMHCISKISKSDVFKMEYRNVSYYEDRQAILSIPDEEISISLPKEQIKNNIGFRLEKCFITDNPEGASKIYDIIIEQYIQQAKTTIQLYDVMKSQQDSFYSIEDTLSEVKTILIENREKEIRLNVEKQQLLKQELHNEICPVIADIMNNYLYFLCKESPKLENVNPEVELSFINSMSDKIKDIIQHIDEYVKEDFCKTPIKATIANGFEHSVQSIDYYRFMEFYFKDKNIQNTNAILNYTDLLDNETYVLILRLRNKLNSPIFPSLVKMGQTNILTCQNIIINVKEFQKVLIEIGRCIINIKENLL